MKLRASLAVFTVLSMTACASGPQQTQQIAFAAVAHPVAEQLPHVLWARSDLVRLRRTVEETLTSSYFAHAGIAIADASGRIVYGKNETRGYAPASTFKTIVAATALTTLGTQAHLNTSLASLDRPDQDGGIDDLWLVGGGDPVLDPDQLREGVAALYRAGVRRVEGDVVVDATSFSGPEQNKAWAPDDFENDYAAGTSAISLNWDVIEFKIIPTQYGQPARVSVVPADPGVVVHGAPITRYATDFRIDRDAPGRNQFTIAGSIAAGAEQSYFRPALGIPMWAGQVVAQMLRERGIELAGDVRLGYDPIAVQNLWEHRSPPLQAMIKQMLFESDNHIAEQLLRVVGTRGGDSLTAGGGSESAGARVERAYLRSMDVPIPGLRVVDGSGLAESDRVAPITIVRLLQAAAHSPIGHVYVSSFPRAGIEGTVRHHDLGPSLGAVRAKSGHIDGVNALAGYIDTRRHGRLAFCFLVNEPDADDAISIPAQIDRLLDTLYML
jgi:D-alanyl-D-alanine carboxypeptidase/D-alanyl-D-alanine-endopeptidase (penicillin-binding protein 4)